MAEADGITLSLSMAISGTVCASLITAMITYWKTRQNQPRTVGPQPFLVQTTDGDPWKTNINSCIENQYFRIGTLEKEVAELRGAQGFCNKYAQLIVRLLTKGRGKNAN